MGRLVFADDARHARIDPEVKPMPTVLREGPYRVYFYSHEPNEPPHVHVDRDDRSAKFWIDPVGVARNLGFASSELRRVARLINSHQLQLLEAWNEYHGA
jgi:hypothetical protein